MLTAADSFCTRILMDLALPIHAAVFQPRVLYLAEKALVFLGAPRQFVLAPSVITTWMNRHHATPSMYRVLARLRVQ